MLVPVLTLRYGDEDEDDEEAPERVQKPSKAYDSNGPVHLLSDHALHQTREKIRFDVQHSSSLWLSATTSQRSKRVVRSLRLSMASNSRPQYVHLSIYFEIRQLRVRHSNVMFFLAMAARSSCATGNFVVYMYVIKMYHDVGNIVENS